MLKRIITLSLLLISLVSLSFLAPAVAESVDIDPNLDNESTVYDLSSNYFVKEDDKTVVPNPDKSKLTDETSPYTLVAENDYLELYLIEDTLNIAVYIKPTGYIFQTDTSYYQYNIEAYFTTGTLAEISSTIPTKGLYSTSLDKNVKPVLTYNDIENGFECHFDYTCLGIEYNLYVYLDDLRLVVYVPEDEIEENPYVVTKTEFKKDDDGNYIIGDDGRFVQITTSTSYQFLIESLTFFTYFGSTYETADEKWMNGYTFIPDGSGALIRYQNQSKYTTAFVKNVYGDDDGIDDDSSSTYYLKDEGVLSLPLFGIVHGYNQNSFLAVIEEGDSNAELHSNPYGYNNQELETTYYKFYFRDTYNIKVATSSSGTITSLNLNRFSGNIKYSYNFLTGEDASYNGFANFYKDKYLTITDKIEESENDIPLNLNVLAQDYKKGLFGKNFQKMTTYKELLYIIKEFEANGVADFNISYIGAFRGGYYNNTNLKPRISYNLGSKKDFLELTSYINNNGYDLSSYIDPVTAFSSGQRYVVKKLNLSTYAKDTKSYLFDEVYQLRYEGLNETVTDYIKQYYAFGIDSVTFTSIGGALSSYRYKSENYYREDNKKTIQEELSLVSQYYEIGLSKANSYTYEYLDKYYDMYTESSSYTFITDSVPFISLLLSGSIELYSEEINFIDDYDKYALRLIEYDIYPTFTITYNDSSKLRYTNYEYLYTSEYSRWKSVIENMYSTVNSALKYVCGAEMVKHEYIAPGVSGSYYSNGVLIVVNYSSSDYTYNGTVVEAHGFEVIK